MKLQTLLIIISLFSFQIILGQQRFNPIVESYKIEVDVSSLSGRTDVSLTCNIGGSGIDGPVQFLFNAESKINSIKYFYGSGWIDIPYEFNGKDSLLLTPGKDFFINNKRSIKFTYSFPAGITNDTILILDRGHRWYPLVMDQVASVKISCKVPSRFSVLSCGNLLETKKEREISEFVYESKLPVFKIPLVIFNRQKFRLASDSITDFFYASIDSVKAASIINKLNKAMLFYNDGLGTFPFHKLTLIETEDFPGINSCSGLLIAGSQSIKMAASGYDDGLILTAAQQWFGAGVFSKFGEKGFFFLNISLPNYLRLMFIRNTGGEEAFIESLMQPLNSYKEFAGKETDIPVIDIDSPNTREKGLVLYGKGPFILSMIEKEIGKEKWLSFLKDLYQTFRGKILTYNEFIKSLSMYDEKESAVKLLNRLTTQKGMPEN
jgi:hypothetical protein